MPVAAFVVSSLAVPQLDDKFSHTPLICCSCAGNCHQSLRLQTDTMAAQPAPGWRIWREHYTRQCRDIPPLTVDGEALPWNGEQLNAFHAAVRHRDRNDARGLPCLVAFCGSRGGVVRVHGERTFVDVATKPGGLLLFDSKVEHEVLSSPRAARAVDDKGRHAPGRISIVFMANIWTHDYGPPAWIRDNHKLLC